MLVKHFFDGVFSILTINVNADGLIGAVQKKTRLPDKGAQATLAVSIICRREKNVLQPKEPSYRHMRDYDTARNIFP